MGTVIGPPDWLDPQAKKLWIKKRDELAGGHIPKPSDGELLAHLCNAEIQLRHAKKIDAGSWQVIKLTEIMRKALYKCKFLNAKHLEKEKPKPENPFIALLHIDLERIDDKKVKSEFVVAANKYARDIVSGKIPASKLMIATCQRHLSDIERSKTKDFDYKFSIYLADRACRIISALPHVKGKWAKHKELLVLEPWQCFLVCSTFGWVHKMTNLRRFRQCYWEICRKNGKSILAAAIGIVMFIGDGEHGAEVYSGATSEKQAWEVFRPARLMLIHTPLLCEAAGVSINAKSMNVDRDGSRFEPVIGKPGDGPSPSCSIVDEFHEHDTSDLVDTMETGMLAREQPLMLKITTAGYNLAGPCYEHRRKAIQVLEGVLMDETVFPVIYGIDEPNEKAGSKGDDWGDPKALEKANPNLGVSVDKEMLLAQQRSAVINITEQLRFKTKHVNVWCSALHPWVSLQQWNAAADPLLTPQEFVGNDCWFMFDLASKLDIAAKMILFRKTINDKKHYYIFGRYFLPEDAIDTGGKNKLVYERWVKMGLLTLTDGATTDFEVIKDEIIEDAKIYNPTEVVYDPFNATHMAQLLMGEGLALVEFTQKPANFALPMDEVQSALKDGRMHHDGNEVMTWMMSNVSVRPAKKGLFWPTKESPEQKIDGPVAMIMGIARAMDAEDSGADIVSSLQNRVSA